MKQKSRSSSYAKWFSITFYVVVYDLLSGYRTVIRVSARKNRHPLQNMLIPIVEYLRHHEYLCR